MEGSVQTGSGTDTHSPWLPPYRCSESWTGRGAAFSGDEVDGSQDGIRLSTLCNRLWGWSDGRTQEARGPWGVIEEKHAALWGRRRFSHISATVPAPIPRM